MDSWTGLQGTGPVLLGTESQHHVKLKFLLRKSKKWLQRLKTTHERHKTTTMRQKLKSQRDSKFFQRIRDHKETKMTTKRPKFTQKNTKCSCSTQFSFFVCFHLQTTEPVLTGMCVSISVKKNRSGVINPPQQVKNNKTSARGWQMKVKTKIKTLPLFVFWW